MNELIQLTESQRKQVNRWAGWVDQKWLLELLELDAEDAGEFPSIYTNMSDAPLEQACEWMTDYMNVRHVPFTAVSRKTVGNVVKWLVIYTETLNRDDVAVIQK